METNERTYQVVISRNSTKIVGSKFSPRRWRNRRPRIFPLPARILRDLTTFVRSGPAPTALRRATAAEVLAIAAPSKALEEITSGTSGTVEIRWPRANRRLGTEEAAKAEQVAKRLIPY